MIFLACGASNLKSDTAFNSSEALLIYLKVVSKKLLLYYFRCKTRAYNFFYFLLYLAKIRPKEIRPPRFSVMCLIFISLTFLKMEFLPRCLALTNVKEEIWQVTRTAAWCEDCFDFWVHDAYLRTRCKQALYSSAFQYYH